MSRERLRGGIEPFWSKKRRFTGVLILACGLSDSEGKIGFTVRVLFCSPNKAIDDPYIRN